MVFTILMLLAISFVVALLVWKVQKNKANKANPEGKCPYHNIDDEESVVGYETAAPAPAIVAVKKKKPAAKKAPVKKTAPKKAKSSPKKK